MPDYTPIADLLRILQGIEVQLVGSTAINGAGSDIDLAVNCTITADFPQEAARDVVQLLARAGCVIGGGAHYEAINLEADDQFTSLRRGDFNLLLCFNERSWSRFTKGRDACILLRDLGVDMTDKRVRVAVHALAGGASLRDVQRDLDRLPRRQAPIGGRRADLVIFDDLDVFAE